jgi:hypothetical protein
MAAEHPTWGEERIANELKLKLTIQASLRSNGKYLRNDRPAISVGRPSSVMMPKSWIATSSW